MFQVLPKYLIKTLEITLYLGLMITGVYFIYLGNVWARYKQKRTNFAEYDEAISELPTLVTWIQYFPNVQSSEYLKFGEDYSIIFWQHPWRQQTSLKEGENWISDENAHPVIGLKLEAKNDFEWKQRLKITPMNFSIGLLDIEFRLTFRFVNAKHLLVSGVKIAISSRNNSNCAYGWDNYDGDVTYVFTRPGEQRKALLKPEKYIFSPDGGDCREQPFNDLEVFRIAEYMNKNCIQPCRRDNYWICNKELESVLPVCDSEENNLCFENAEGIKVKDQEKNTINNILIKPCTKLQYKVDEDTYSYAMDQVEFVFHFTKPPMTTVKEEYLIYDLVAMISSVGGTLGLFTGFTFLEMGNWLVKLLERPFLKIIYKHKT